MKRVASIILGFGLVLPGVSALAADAPAAGAEKKAAAAAAPKGPAGSPAVPTVVLEPDGVAFGMSMEDVAKLYDRWWDKQFVPRYRTTNPGPKTRELDFELAQQKKVLRRVAIFDGRPTSLDKADFREEFAHGSGETMIASELTRQRPAAKDPLGRPSKAEQPVTYTRRFFFFQDKLWKVYDEYRLEPSSPLGADFENATARVQATLGKSAKRTRGPESRFENVAFDAGSSRVRVVKLASDRVAVVRSDTALTQQVLDRRAQQARAAAAPELDEDIQAVIR